MEPLLNPKKISLTIEVKNFIGIKQKNVDIKLIRIDDYFYHKAKEYESKTNEDGIANFKSILEGAYFVQTLKNKILIEQIIGLRKNQAPFNLKPAFLKPLRQVHLKAPSAYRKNYSQISRLRRL